MKIKLLTLIFCFQLVCSWAQQKAVFTIQADKPTAEVSPAMWGIFFEDINFGADGGLYAELVKNRSFEFYNPLMGWCLIKEQGATGNLYFVNVGSKSPQNTRYAHIRVDAEKGSFGLSNEGYRGIGVKQGAQYNF